MTQDYCRGTMILGECVPPWMITALVICTAVMMYAILIRTGDSYE